MHSRAASYRSSLRLALFGLVIVTSLSPPSRAAEASGLTLAESIQVALRLNPDLVSLRRQHDVDAAGVVISRTYPYNPSYQTKIEGVQPGPGESVARSISEEHQLQISVEVRGQSQFRKALARATLSRTDAEILAAEQALTARVTRLHAAVIYRQRKLELIEATVALNERAEAESEQLAEHGLLRGADSVLVGTETADALASRSTARIALTAARNELNGAIGTPGDSRPVVGSLVSAPPALDRETLLSRALVVRGDLLARNMAVQQAHSRLGFTRANRYGNPTVGVVYEQDSSREELLGATLTLPIPVLNSLRGNIRQDRANEERAAEDVRQIRIGVRQGVEAGFSRLQRAQEAVDQYRDVVLPKLAKSRSGVERLFQLGDPAADVLRVFDVRRKQLRAKDGYLDALFEVRQALADLVAAVGDVELIGRIEGAEATEVTP